MTALSDRLKALGVRLGVADLPAPEPHGRSEPGGIAAIETVVPGRFESTPLGEAFVSETVYPTGHRLGHAPLDLAGSLLTVAQWAREERVAELAPGGFAFLDTETSGLAGGTGTYAFLVGIGRHQDDGFHLTQVFMRDPAEEPALLHLVAGLLRPCEALVTFNGKSFDMPLLSTRFTLHGADLPAARAPHVDLLPLARRLWRDRLESRALSFLEVHILGHQRDEEEVPGWLVPQLYFDYLRSGDAGPLKGVFYHNAMDVVALAALFSHVTGLLEDPLANGREHPSDLSALARLYEDLGRPDQAAALYQEALRGGLTAAVLADTVRRLSFLQRRRGQQEAAVDLWREAAEGRQAYACVALAKVLEHERRDYGEALARTEEALRLSETSAPGPGRERSLAELAHRKQRLERKLAAGERVSHRGAETQRDG